jgi:hypothetical protein
MRCARRACSCWLCGQSPPAEREERERREMGVKGEERE